MRGRLVRALVFIGLIAGAVAAEWKLVPVPPPAQPQPSRADEWTLPRITAPQAARAVEVLNRTSPWGKLAQPGALPEDNSWKIVGIIARGDERSVVLRLGRQREQQLKKGDRLPDGSTIVDIHEDSLTLMTDGRKRRLSIYPGVPLT
ncbi:MAG TPA: hypothetical protein VFP44_17415 [Usitatibacter sp.]|nr:hypothetical protein [Usitatibacter sp.]